MKNFTAFCLLALGAAAVKIESQSLGSSVDSLTQLRSDGAEFVCSIADAIEEVQDRDEGSDRDETVQTEVRDDSDSDDDAAQSESGDESDSRDDGAQTVGLADPFGNETDI